MKPLYVAIALAVIVLAAIIICVHRARVQRFRTETTAAGGASQATAAAGTSAPAARAQTQNLSTESVLGSEDFLISTVEMPEVPSDDEAMTAFNELSRRAGGLEYDGKYDEAARLWEESIRKYPIGPGTWEAMRHLARTYEKLGRIDDARQVMYSIKRLFGDERIGNIIEIELAELDRRLGDNRAAEERLRTLMSKPAPEQFDAASILQHFNVPLRVAKICDDELRLDEAEALVADVRARATAIAHEHPEAEWAVSYAAAACVAQAELLFDRDMGENLDATIEKVRRLAAEFRQEFPIVDSSKYVRETELRLREIRHLRRQFDDGIEMMIDFRTRLKDSAAGEIIRKRDEERRRKLKD